MAIVFNAPQDRFGISSAGSILAQSMLNNSQEKLRNQRGVEQEQRQQNRLLEAEKRQRESQLAAGSVLGEALQKGGIDQLLENPAALYNLAQEKNVDVGSLLDQFNTLATLRNNQVRATPQQKTPPPSVFRKEIDKSMAQTLLNLPKVESLGSTIDRLDTLSKELEGLGGYGKALFNTEDAAEFNALGLTVMEPVLKIFNPVGAIPTQKIELVKSKYSPNAWDNASTIRGKLNAIRKIQQSALKKSQNLQDLINQYGSYENIPDTELFNFSRDSEQEIDRLIEQPLASKSKGTVEKGITSSQAFESLPPAKDYKSKRIKDTNSGKIYVSDGKKWSLVR